MCEDMFAYGRDGLNVRKTVHRLSTEIILTAANGFISLNYLRKLFTMCMIDTDIWILWTPECFIKYSDHLWDVGHNLPTGLGLWCF